MDELILHPKTNYCGFISPSSQMPGQYLKLGHNNFYILFNSFITHSIIWCYIVWTTDSVAKYTIYKSNKLKHTVNHQICYLHLIIFVWIFTDPLSPIAL